MLSKIKDFIDHERYTVIGAALGVALVALVACQPKTDNPFTPDINDPITASELKSETEAFNVRVSAKEKDIRAEFEQGVNQLTAKANKELRALGAETESTALLVESAYADLEAKTENLNFFIGLGQTIFSSIPSLPVTGLGASLITAAGLALDNRRKNGVIENKKAEVKQLKGIGG